MTNAPDHRPDEAPDKTSASDPELPRELREALDSMTTPDPCPEFRAKLRGAFVAGDLRCSDTAVESALGEWEVPPANDAFRERCRAAFLSGATPAAPPLRRVGGATPAAPLGGRLLRWLPAAAAVIAALLLVPELLRDSARWEKVEGGAFSVNGVSVSEPTKDELHGMIHAGSSCKVECGGEPVLMSYGGMILLRMDPSAVVSFDEVGDPIVLTVDKGSLQFSFRRVDAPELIVNTPDGRMRISGEAVGVNVRETGGTCVCCLDGKVEVHPTAAGAAAYTLRAGDSTWLPRGSSEPKIMRGEVHHGEVLEDLRESASRHFY